MAKRFCPKCMSEDVGPEVTTSMALGAPQEWKCKKCGYHGDFFPTKEKINKTKINKK